MNELQSGAKHLNYALKRADYIATFEGGAITYGEPKKPKTKEEVQRYLAMSFEDKLNPEHEFATPILREGRLPGEWGGTYESMRKDFAEAFTTLVASGRVELLEASERVIYCCHHLPSADDIREGAVTPYWHRDPELSIDATPQDRARWVVRTQKDHLVNIISRLYILEAMGHPEQADQTLAKITGSIPRSLANLSEVERHLIRALHSLGAREGYGKRKGEIVKQLQNNGYHREENTIQRNLTDTRYAAYISYDGEGRGRTYSLTEEGWRFGEALKRTQENSQ